MLSEGSVVLVIFLDMASEGTRRTYLTILCIGHCVLLRSCRQEGSRASGVTVSQHFPLLLSLRLRINTVCRRTPEVVFPVEKKSLFVCVCVYVFGNFQLKRSVLFQASGSVHP